MTRPRLAADLALVHLLRQSLLRWLAAADFRTDAADFDAMPPPMTDKVCTAWADEIVRRNEVRYAVLGFRLGAEADTAEGKAVAAAALKVPDRTGDRALLQLVTDTYGIGTPPWLAAVTAVETIAILAKRVGLRTVNTSRFERRPDPVADALRLLGAFELFRSGAAAPILDRARTSIPTAALPAT